ncbi:hypothetical protein AGRA3207_000567 [Actinomadura graeca]|uniref:Transcriptional regulator n=1 Tax=Actinomadura graeca TaxID=2750812 RepID=A0ABX8QN49_9ACTN|nr:hypothetical protein [Actinomadura graeca]QXJ19950.1 hypothetical protein AGRA3207_000567 [Actinomadura graeca]
MSPEEVDARVELAETRYLKAKKEADALLEDLFSAYVDAADAGRTADQLAKPEIFTAGYIRKKLRERGVEPRKGGPRARKS